jgi:CHAT domain-containing protein
MASHRIGAGILLLVGILLGAGPHPARAATPEALCRTAGSEAVAGQSGDSGLQQASASAETILARRGASPEAAEQALRALEVGSDSPQAASAEDLAAYCAVAGEAMRHAPMGSPAQAQAFLLSAARYAQLADEPAIAARAAYRLGLSATVPQASGASRSARGALRAASVDPSPLLAEASASGRCAALLDPAFLSGPSLGVSHASLECAVEQASEAGDSEILSLSQLRLARLHLVAARRMPEAADELLAQAVEAAVAGLSSAAGIGAPRLRAELIGRLTEAALDSGADSPAIAGAIAAMRASAPNDPAALAFAAALEGRLALRRGDRASASAALQQAVFLEGQRSQPLRLADWLLLLAEAEPARREVLLMQAYRALESVRPLLPLADPLTEESTFELRMRPVFEAAVAIQLAVGEEEEELRRIAAAQEIVEAFRQAEIQSALGSECVPPSPPVEPGDLVAGEILLYPVLLEDRIELISAARVGDGEAPHYRRLPVNRQAGRATVTRLANDMAYSIAYGSDDSWREPARQLYDLLIAPIEAQLGPDSTLVVVPDGPLRGIPFAALLDADGTYLVERTRLSIAPALSYSRPGAPRDGQPLSVVAASLEKDVRLPAGFFPALAGTAAEARVAAGLGDPDQAGGRYIEDFSKADLNRALSREQVDVLHLATHAAFNGRSDRSFIVADNEAIPLGELRELIGSSRTRGEEIDLLVLSACETAVGDDQASMGLAGAAVQAGAVSAIASLWQVSDAGTVELMRHFYQAYGEGQGKAAALRNAQVALIRSGQDLADPSIWAAFTLLGAWR